MFEARLHAAGTTEVGHGRLEVRQVHTSADIPAGYTGFVDVAQVFGLQRRSVKTRTGEIRQETVYGLISLAPSQASPRRLLGWVRDVVFDEDRSQVRCGNIPQVMAALRNTVIGLLRLNGKRQIAAACRRHAARPEEALALLGIPKTE